MTKPTEVWAILELMGYRRRVGRVSEVEMFGAKLLRIDIPGSGEDITEFYGPSAIYSLQPIPEPIARAEAARFTSAPTASEYLLMAPADSWPVAEPRSRDGSNQDEIPF